jgi:hypothetical protein
MQHNEKILGIDSSRDEKLESLIRNIAGDEVEEKVEKFKEEYTEQKEKNMFSHAVRNILSK